MARQTNVPYQGSSSRSSAITAGEDRVRDLRSWTDWLTAKEAAAYLKMKVKTLLREVRQGKIRGYALTGTTRHVWRFRREDLDAAVLAHPVLMSEAPTVLSTERRIA